MSIHRWYRIRELSPVERRSNAPARGARTSTLESTMSFSLLLSSNVCRRQDRGGRPSTSQAACGPLSTVNSKTTAGGRVRLQPLRRPHQAFAEGTPRESPAGYVRTEPAKEGTDQELINRKGRDSFLATAESNLSVDSRRGPYGKRLCRAPCRPNSHGLEHTPVPGLVVVRRLCPA